MLFCVINFALNCTVHVDNVTGTVLKWQDTSSLLYQCPSGLVPPGHLKIT